MWRGSPLLPGNIFSALLATPYILYIYTYDFLFRSGAQEVIFLDQIFKQSVNQSQSAVIYLSVIHSLCHHTIHTSCLFTNIKGEIQVSGGDTSPRAGPCLYSKSCPLLPLKFNSPDCLKENLLCVLNVTCRCVAGGVLSRHLLTLCPDLRLSCCYFQGLGSVLKDSLSPKLESMGVGSDCVYYLLPGLPLEHVQGRDPLCLGAGHQLWLEAEDGGAAVPGPYPHQPPCVMNLRKLT